MKKFLFLSLIFISASALAQIAETSEEICPLLIGERVPDTGISSIENEKSSLQELVKKQPTVLLFYRGGWCPFCNAHLAAVGEITEEITSLGYQIIAVSPDSPEKLKLSQEEQKLDYQLFSDADGSLIKAMGLAFKSPERYGSMLIDFSAGENTGFLPAPALFLVNTEGIIEFEYISPDYKNRIEADLLLSILKFYSTNK